MKKIFILIFCLALSFPVMAQQQTLAAGGFESGGYGGPSIHYNSIKGNSGLFIGGEGGWIANKTFILGAGGWALASNIAASKFNAGSNGNLDYSCGGIKLGLIINSDALTHFVIHSLIGWGQVGYKPSGGSASNVSNITVIEPGIDYEINIAPFFRIALGGTYRMVSGVDSTQGLSDEDLSSATFGMTFKFGSFGKSD